MYMWIIVENIYILCCYSVLTVGKTIQADCFYYWIVLYTDDTDLAGGSIYITSSIPQICH